MLFMLISCKYKNKPDSEMQQPTYKESTRPELASTSRDKKHYQWNRLVK